MNKTLILKLEIELCDRNRGFDEIIDSIYQTIKERDGIDGFKISEDRLI